MRRGTLRVSDHWPTVTPAEANNFMTTPNVETAKRASDSLDPLVRLCLSAYLKEECQGCHKTFDTLDELMDAVWWPWEKGRVGHKACYQANK